MTKTERVSFVSRYLNDGEKNQLGGRTTFTSSGLEIREVSFFNFMVKQGICTGAITVRT